MLASVVSQRKEDKIVRMTRRVIIVFKAILRNVALQPVPEKGLASEVVAHARKISDQWCGKMLADYSISDMVCS